ncbi:unnamed protein product, partial [Callosobruchus maculatus]
KGPSTLQAFQSVARWACLSLLSFLACKLISKPYYIITILMYMIIILSY